MTRLIGKTADGEVTFDSTVPADYTPHISENSGGWTIDQILGRDVVDDDIVWRVQVHKTPDPPLQP